MKNIVVTALTEYIFNENLIPNLVLRYKQYYLEKNSALLRRQENLRKRLNEIKKEINNLIILASKVASEALVQKLSDLEIEKNNIEEQYKNVASNNELDEQYNEKFAESFQQAKVLMKNGELTTIKKLIESLLDKVVVYENYINVFFKYHPELSIS